MQIACPNCATAYEIEATTLGDGRLVRCVHCRETWFAQPADARALALAEADAAGAAAPSMWQEEQPVSAWAGRDTGGADIQPEDRFAEQNGEIEFGLPDEMRQLDGAPSIAPEADTSLGEGEIAAGGLQPEGAFDDGHDPGANPVEPTEADEPDYFEVRRRRKVRQATAKPRGPLITKPRVIAAMVGILIALVFERENISRMMPQLATLYSYLGMPVNLRGVAFTSMRAGLEQQDGVSVLVIEGELRNVTKEPVEVPRLRFAMRNSTGAEIYSWTALPDRAVLPPGESQSFRTRLASPPADSRQIYVRFFQRRDVVAAAQPRNDDGAHSARGR